MSRKERKRLTVMAGVTEKKLTLVQAAKLMRVCYRQSKRIWKRYPADGDGGLVHRLRGQPSARRKPAALRARALARYAEERYADFGPTLMAEQLAKEQLVVDHETLRRWRLAEGQHTVRRRKQVHREWRERKPSFGAMVQLDGSHHDWFEGRGPKCVLRVMVDDATNQMRARFFPEETTRASYDVLEGWARKHGLPDSLYVDRDSIYRCEGAASIAEQLAGEEPQTQFGRAMKALGVELILANSPQAKGRVERMNGTLQDRLVKELRLAGISDLESANQFLDGKYLRAFNRQFARGAASPVDVHGAVPRNLNEVLSWEEERVVQCDWTVACEGKRYQLDRQHEALNLVRRKVIVRTLRNGRVQLVHRDQRLKWRILPQGAMRPPPPARKARKVKTKTVVKPPALSHPWRQLGVGAGRKFWHGIKAKGRAPPAGETEERRTTNKGDI
ncbi:MAG TPA: ISNCY family transposase, partial [Tepidisphaeraceae bacterium]|nr:ISNCY family transposase [Tepidisphaeraceae bacterium]